MSYYGPASRDACVFRYQPHFLLYPLRWLVDGEFLMNLSHSFPEARPAPITSIRIYSVKSQRSRDPYSVEFARDKVAANVASRVPQNGFLWLNGISLPVGLAPAPRTGMWDGMPCSGRAASRWKLKVGSRGPYPRRSEGAYFALRNCTKIPSRA